MASRVMYRSDIKKDGRNSLTKNIGNHIDSLRNRRVKEQSLKSFINNAKNSLNYSKNNSIIMKLNLYGISRLNPKQILQNYLIEAEKVYNKDTNKSNIIYIDSNNFFIKCSILFNTILVATNKTFYPDLWKAIEAFNEDIKNEKFSNKELKKIYKWYKDSFIDLKDYKLESSNTMLSISKKVKEEILPSLSNNLDKNILITLIKYFLALSVNSPKLIVIKNPEKLDLFSLIIIDRLIEINEFFKVRGINIGINFIYLNEKYKSNTFKLNMINILEKSNLPKVFKDRKINKSPKIIIINRNYYLAPANDDSPDSISIGRRFQSIHASYENKSFNIFGDNMSPYIIKGDSNSINFGEVVHSAGPIFKNESLNISGDDMSLNLIMKDKAYDIKRIRRVYYGTNRKYNGKEYTSYLDNKINYGYSDVFVPKSHNFGSIGSSWWEKLISFNLDELKNLFTDDRLKIISLFSTNKDKFFQEIRENIGENDTLIYIHGYNTSFEEATIRAAQIGFDLKIPLTAFFSWPSSGKLKNYLYDGDMIQNSEENIVEFLENFAKNVNPEKIHIIAHSMGNRGLLRAFQRMFHLASSNSNIKFGQIFLAAPDVTVELFKDLATLYPEHSKRTTLYVSNKDKALGMSEWLGSYPRVGLLPPITIVKDIDTIEVTNIDITTLGHSYFAEAEALLYDIKDLILNNKNPSDRIRLQAIENYWQFTK